MFEILRKELNGFLNSLIAYIVISVFLTGIGLLMWVFPETSVLEYGYADMETLFALGPYVFMFLIPAITMRMFAEEKKAGTIELLLTKPLTDWQIILGKYFSGFLLVLFALIPTLVYYYTIYQLGNPVGNVDTAGVVGSYIGLALLGGVFTSIGVFSSLITTNQIVSFIIAVFLCFIFYTGFESLASINVWGAASLFLEQLGIVYHYRAMSKGLLDTRNLIYFLSVIGVMLMFTKFILGSRRW
ncbi:gliding motility-associated ABC transporter permease subunit GldF [Fulvivirga sp.]|uniref:gliding motility-associated ABC transporter permease subunit GldF n=1 Tax=Fulvivirga sp. TaxID=1931237 RepID=UPI0032F025C6